MFESLFIPLSVFFNIIGSGTFLIDFRNFVKFLLSELFER